MVHGCLTGQPPAALLLLLPTGFLPALLNSPAGLCTGAWGIRLQGRGDSLELGPDTSIDSILLALFAHTDERRLRAPPQLCRAKVDQCRKLTNFPRRRGQKALSFPRYTRSMEGDRQRRCRASMHARKLRPSGKTPAALSGLLLAIAFCPQLGFTRLADEWQPVGKCEVLGKQYDCGLRDGCEWCVNETAATGPSCMGWEKCTGPAALCDLKEDNATCTSPLCAWCQMQGRCIRADGPVEVNGTAGSQVFPLAQATDQPPRTLRSAQCAISRRARCSPRRPHATQPPTTPYPVCPQAQSNQNASGG